jgi:hypothetical protein
MFLDGDHPQTMALVNGVLTAFEDYNISVLKCPGGTSGISQPNDLMKCHMIFRQATTLASYWEAFDKKTYELKEYWIKLILPYFQLSGVSAASQDTYDYFFSTLKSLIDKSFNNDNITKGNNMFNYFCIHK